MAEDSETKNSPEREPSDDGIASYGGSFEKLHPAVQYFTERLTELRAAHPQRVKSTGELRPLSPHQLLTFLAQQAPELPMSQTQMYRICMGTAIPKIDLILELSLLFDVDPEYFFPTVYEARKMSPWKSENRLELS